ncbi:hypothetical protein [Mesorhizobium sp. SP-1A]|uniref:hypothetical protein n=1 Tax=Mesorhizobium sp. SP-1A TaxID=3077840 RepID=UPI0028F6F8AF|nr:hypothetical protein [Mesorhizobium sp. SP-1A]
MTIRKWAALAAALCVTSSCATPPQNIKATASDGNACTAADRQRLSDLYQQQSRTATQDALGVFMIGVPLGGADQGPEIARLKGRCGDPSKK